MWWNQLVKDAVTPFFSRRGIFTPLLCSAKEKHERLFGHYEFHMDLSLGRLQRILFLKPKNYELETQDALRGRVKPGDTVLDIGANSGYFSLLMADLVGSQGKVISFEPVPVSFDLLKKNIQVNNIRTIEPLQLALSNKAGSAVLHLHPTNDGAHSLGNLGAGTQEITVQTETLDRFLEARNIHDVAVIKIDVEGAESLVFEGAKRLLSSAEAPDIICEVSDLNQRQTGGSEKALREVLYQYGYRSYLLEEEGREIVRDEPVRGLVNILFSKRSP